MMTLVRTLILITLLFISSCTNSSNPVGPITTTPGTGKIFTGPSVDLGSQTIGTSGGTITINKPGDTLNGFQISVPVKGFTTSKTFSVSYALVTSYQVGSNFNPVSPLIKISYDGGYSDVPMSVRVPIHLPSGYYAMGFFYDETTGDLEAVPTTSLDTASITISTRHFSSSSQPLSKGQFKSNAGAWTSLIVSSIKQSLLDFSVVLSTDFAPGKDDWEFPNYGSYIAPGGHCTGQSMSAIWYWYEKYKKAGEPRLFHRYDKVIDPLNPSFCWVDNPLGYRFASTIQSDYNWDNYVAQMNSQATTPDIVWHDFIDAFLTTAKPQVLIVREPIAEHGHALVVYKIDVLQGILYLADPNYPGNYDPNSGAYTERKILYQGGKFLPYSSAAFAGDAATTYTQIGFGGKTAIMPWGLITSRWPEFLNGTTGNDRFPTYTLSEDHTGAVFADGLDTDLDSIKVVSVSNGCPFWLAGTLHRQPINGYDTLGTRLASNSQVGQLTLALKPGDNSFGLYMMGFAADTHAHYLDFKWMRVHRHMSLTIASTEANGAPVSTPGVKNKLYTFIAKSAKPVPKDGKVRYDWSFGDGSAVTSVNNDSTITHTFTNDGADAMSVTFYYGGTKITQVSATATIASAVPVITSIVPSTGKVGDTVKVKGKNFGSDQTKGSVTFSSGVTATGIIGWVDTMVTVKVPQGIQTGPVTVTVNGLTSNAVTFNLPPPSVTSIVPSTGKVGDTVKVKGKNFGSDQTKGSVTFSSGVTATGIIGWVDTMITVKVPQAAQSGSVTVTVNGVTSNAVTFTVTSTVNTKPQVDSVWVWVGGPTLPWGLPGWRLDVRGQNFMSSATDTPSVYVGTNKLPVVYSASSEADAIIPTMTTGTYDVSVIRKDGVASSNTKPIYIGIPQSDIDLHSDAYMDFTFYYTYYNATMGRVDTMGKVGVRVAGTVTWTSNGFTLTMTPSGGYFTYATLVVTFSQGEASVDLTWKVQYLPQAPQEQIHYAAQHVRALTDIFPPLIFGAETPPEMKRVTTQLSGTVLSRQGVSGQVITGLVPDWSGFSIALPGITH